MCARESLCSSLVKVKNVVLIKARCPGGGGEGKVDRTREKGKIGNGKGLRRGKKRRKVWIRKGKIGNDKGLRRGKKRREI